MTVQGVRNTKVGQAEGTGPFFHAWIFPLTIPLVSPCVQCKLYLTMSKQCLPANISKLLAWEFYGHAVDNKFLASRFRLLYFLHHESLYSSFNRKLFVIRGHSTAALLCSSLLLSHKKNSLQLYDDDAVDNERTISQTSILFIICPTRRLWWIILRGRTIVGYNDKEIFNR